MMPIMITVTLSRDNRKMLINANCIEEIMAACNLNTDDIDDFEQPEENKNTTFIFIHGRPTLRVKETPEQITHEIKVSVIDLTTTVVNRLHAMGFIH